jgi:hypothetical protein
VPHLHILRTEHMQNKDQTPTVTYQAVIDGISIFSFERK